MRCCCVVWLFVVVMSAAPSSLLSSIRLHSTALNLRPLQRIDPLTQSVLFTGKHTVLYRLDRHSEQWERDNVEGPFFIVSRSAAPYYQLVILNRLGLDAWLLPLLADTRHELQEEQYLFIQSGADVVGVWFYEQSDAQQAAQRLQQLTQLTSSSTHYDPTTTHSTADTAIDPSSTNDSSQLGSISHSNSRQQRPSGRGVQPIVVSSGKRLHSQPPPPPTLPLSDAVDGASEAELQSRLKTFLGKFSEEDESYSEAHREARTQQSSGLQVAKAVHAAPLAALTAAELERSLSAERTVNHSHATLDSAVELHPLVSQLFHQSANTIQQQQPTLPPSLSSPSLPSHSYEQPASSGPSYGNELLAPTSFTAVPSQSAGPWNPATPHSTPSLLCLRFPPLPASLTRAAFVGHIHEALSDERVVAELYLQYTQQQRQQQHTSYGDKHTDASSLVRHM